MQLQGSIPQFGAAPPRAENGLHADGAGGARRGGDSRRFTGASASVLLRVMGFVTHSYCIVRARGAHENLMNFRFPAVAHVSYALQKPARPSRASRAVMFRARARATSGAVLRR